ncbi:MAG: winged helix-turn-helix domain-containing protein [Acidobacteriota bacterium]
MSRGNPNKLTFAPFEADLATGELRRDGERVVLQEKPFQLLAALLETPGELVPRETLRHRLWPDTFVDFDANLNASVKKLREALADSASQPRYVETVPKRGYRFIAPVTPGGEAATDAGRRWPRGPVTVIAATIVLLALGTVGAGWLRTPSAPAERVMLAVLPFANLSDDAAREYVADGMTEELLTALGRLQPDRLGVIARITAMTYKGSDKPVAEIGRELEVDYVLEGSVRGGADRERFTAQLIAVSDQTHLWAETYDTDAGERLDVQADIARRIARALALELLPNDDATTTTTAIPAAHDHFLRGRHQWHRFTADGYANAIAELERATEIDPAYAAAWAALADAHNLQAFEIDSPVAGFDRARQAAERALALEPDLAEAHNALAFAVLYGQYDAATADPIFRRARELHPNYAMSFHWHAGALAALGRHDEAIAAVRHAVALDPLSLSALSDLGWYYLFADRWQDAVRECRTTLELSPGYSWALRCLVEGLARSGHEAEAVRLSLDHLRQKGRLPMENSPHAGLSETSELADLRRYQLDLELQKDEAEADALWRAMLYSDLGQPDDAAPWLERAFERHNPWLVFLRVDPRLDGLHRHPRFEALAKQLRIGGE